MNRVSCWASSLFSVLGLAVSVSAQGRTDYVNFESPQVKPVALAKVGASNDPYLLVCNTPDNRVEVFDLTDPDAPVPERRVLVGLEPVSVTFESFANGRQMMYTANWLGDSVTFVELFSTNHVLSYKFVGTFPINHTTAFSTTASLDSPQAHADEPVHVLAVDGASPRVLVAKRFGSSFSWLDAFTGAPVTFDPDGTTGPRNAPSGGGIDVVMTDVGLFPRDLDGSFTTGGTPLGSVALKEPQCLLLAPSGRIWALGQQGGGSEIPFPVRNLGAETLPPFDLDLWTWQPGTPAVPPVVLGGMGTTNFNAVFDSAGEMLYVAGTQARNGTTGDAALSSMPTGFAQTLLYRVQVDDLDPAASTVASLDINSPGLFLGQVTDIDMFEPASGEKFVIAAGFNGDRFARILVHDLTGALDPPNWVVASAAAPKLGAAGEMAGPRGVAVDDETKRGYFLNAVDNSIFVAELSTLVPSTPIPLANDPLPDHVRLGKKFLYSNAGSAIGMACANCHIDGRSDQLPWRLSAEQTDAFSTTAAGDTLGPNKGFEFNTDFAPRTFEPYQTTGSLLQQFQHYLDQLLTAGVGFPSVGGFGGDNPKGMLVTQSLQGLVNFEVQADGELGHYFSNAPYHWRGDKKTFLDFEGAFASLQATPGIGPDEMEQYEEFIASIHYPPNAIQPITRHYSGDIGALGSGDGSGAQRGMKLFHIEPLAVFEGRSCIYCHVLPAGTDNRWTTVESPLDDVPVDPFAQPLNTAALRGLRQKEGRLEIDSSLAPAVGSPDFLQTGDFGMAHDGIIGFSISDFPTPLSSGSKADVAEFMREFDTGIAPIVGRTITILRSDVNAQGNIKSAVAWKNVLVSAMEAQARAANCGLVAHFYNDDGIADGDPSDVELARAFWFKVSMINNHLLPVIGYKEENNATNQSRSGILLLMSETADRVSFTATPLGSERRIASLSGDANEVSSTPTSIQQIGTVPNSANADAIGMTLNGTLDWLDGLPAPTRVLAFQKFREVLGPTGLDLIDPRQPGEHELSRRLRFTGTGLQEGGKVRLGVNMGTLAAPDYQFMELPIYPTDNNVSGQRTWETAVEFDGLTLYLMLLGGPKADGVGAVLQGGNPPTSDFHPDLWKFRLGLVPVLGTPTPEVDVQLAY